MCVVSKVKSPYVAKDDIVCYKVVTVNRNGVAYSPYFDVCIDESIINGKRPYDVEGQGEVSPMVINGNREFLVGKGFVHTCKTKKDAITLAVRFKKSKIYKCIIPKGTLYFKGSDDYASKSITFKKSLWLTNLFLW